MKITRASCSRKEDSKVPKYARRPFNDHQWIYLADKLREWADKETSLYLDIFALSWGYSPYKFKKKWPAENEYFAEALEYALGVINVRRNDMLTFDKEIVDRRDWLDKRPLYDQEFKEWLIEKSASNKEAQADSVINVIMNKMPETDIVKPLKKADD